MAYRSTHYGARISPKKVCLIADVIRGKKADEALTILRFSKQRGAVFFRQVLTSAIANADQSEADVRHLVVVDARVDHGPVMKRWQPKDRGRSHPILKRTSHITVAVDVK
jgi:large subunit ribosomal protein L22